MATQTEVIHNLKRWRCAGVSLANVSGAGAALLDAVIYLVENTPEARR